MTISREWFRGQGRANKNAYDDALANGWIGETESVNGVIAAQLVIKGQDALYAAMANPGPFDDDFKPYGTNDGPRGSRDRWAGAFEDAQDLGQPAESILKGKNPYAVLGIARDSDFETVKRAFRAKVKKAHPDHGGSDEAARLIMAAYEVIRERLEGKTPVEETPEAVHVSVASIMKPALAAPAIPNGFMDDSPLEA